jgi:hypothetical protein
MNAFIKYVLLVSQIWCATLCAEGVVFTSYNNIGRKYYDDSSSLETAIVGIRDRCMISFDSVLLRNGIMDVMSSNYMPSVLYNLPLSNHVSWIAHFADCGVIFTNNGFCFVPKDNGDKKIGTLWSSCQKESLDSIMNCISKPCLLPAESLTLYGFSREIVSLGKFSVIYEPSDIISNLWERRCIHTSRSSTWKQLFDELCAQNGLEYRLQGGVLFVAERNIRNAK